MTIRITKTRLALAGLFVLAGMGLGSILSPLVGDALATVGSTVNISDHSSSAYFAKVTSAGELKTNGVVSGKVAPALPPQPFNVVRQVFVSMGETVLGPTTGTVALTDVTFANSFNNGARQLILTQYSAAAPNAGCTAAHSHAVVNYEAPSAQTVVQDLVTPTVLKPLSTGEAWCLEAFMSGPAGETDYGDFVTLSGYVLSGNFTPPISAPAKLGRITRKR